MFAVTLCGLCVCVGGEKNRHIKDKQVNATSDFQAFVAAVRHSSFCLPMSGCSLSDCLSTNRENV